MTTESTPVPSPAPAPGAPVEITGAEAVAHQAQAPLLPVPDREGEHADQALDRGAQAPFGNRLNDHFSVGMAPETVA